MRDEGVTDLLAIIPQLLNLTHVNLVSNKMTLFALPAIVKFITNFDFYRNFTMDLTPRDVNHKDKALFIDGIRQALTKRETKSQELKGCGIFKVNLV